jgi:hypothetical protein
MARVGTSHDGAQVGTACRIASRRSPDRRFGTARRHPNRITATMAITFPLVKRSIDLTFPADRRPPVDHDAS